ncbi:Uu.00g062720.m01.CDS01 [Anthostomella pinea]|uniref:Uu.00g062720.m01.CDS01 n=1 Tax=Anthostomella pinea TaxID=933095 RepID=A0AAI8VT72_9PEZI|nr:Uu.00g062720.m01.CDS01 [Anthostomella pinea]
MTLPVGGMSAGFVVSDFVAEAVPHSTLASYTFKAGIEPNVIPTTCAAQPNTFSRLVSVGRTACQDDTKYTWSWTFDDDGSSQLELWFEFPSGDDRVLHGVRNIPAEQIVWTNQQSPTGTVQAYDGPDNFTVSYLPD